MKNLYSEVFSKLLNSYYKLSEKQLQRFLQDCEVRNFGKQHIISEDGQKNTVEYFLLEGIIHRYKLIEKGEFITTGFYEGPTITTPNFARTSNQLSVFSLQALTHVTLVEVPVSVLDELRKSDEDIRKWGQKVVENELKRSFAEETMFRSSNAKERLIYLRNSFSNLENLVPHTCIASFVGVTPVSFSRLRKELASS